MSTLLQSKSAVQVRVTSVTRRPRAIIVILGKDDGAAVSKIYQTKKCSTVSCANPDGSIAVCRETARLIRMAQLSEMGAGPVPVVLHVVSNKGRGILKQVQEDLQQQQQQHVVVSPIGKKLPCMRGFSSSTRSLITNVTDPLSDDEMDDVFSEGSSHEKLSFSPPSVHRVDMERTGLTLSNSSNPDERAHSRDLHLFRSHLTMTFWDMEPTSMSWMHFLFALVWAAVHVWKTFVQGNRGTSWSTDGLSLTGKHAIVYQNALTFESFWRQASAMDLSILRCQLPRPMFRRRRRAQYEDFVKKVLDNVAQDQADDDGFSSDEDE